MVRSSVVHAVLFIAIVSAATLFVGMMVTETALFADSIEDEADRTAAAIDTEITFIDDPEAGGIYDANEGVVQFHVKNVGGETLEVSELETLLNGIRLDPSYEVRHPDADRWRVGTVLQVTADRTLDGDHPPPDGRPRVHDRG